MCRAFLHRIPLLPFPFGHASILTVFSLRFSHHGNLPGTITLWALRSLEPRSTYRAVFSGHFRSLCGSTVAHTSAGGDPATGGTDQTRTGGLLIPNQARYQLRYGSILAADGGVDPHGFRRALFSRQAPRPLEFICRIGWRFCTMHDQESNLTVWGLGPRCTSKDDRHPMLRGIGFVTAL